MIALPAWRRPDLSYKQGALLRLSGLFDGKTGFLVSLNGGSNFAPNARSLLHQWPHRQGKPETGFWVETMFQSPPMPQKPFSSAQTWTAPHTGSPNISVEKAINLRDLYRPQGCAAGRGGGSPRPRTSVERTAFPVSRL
jgi:hypothetical protein